MTEDKAIRSCPKCGQRVRVPFLPGKTLEVRCPRGCGGFSVAFIDPEPPDENTARELGEAEAYFERGNSLAEACEFDEACEQYAKAVAISPRCAEIYGNWGQALFRTRRLTEACEKLAKAVEIDPRLAMAYANWGAALVSLGKASEACDKCAKAVEIDPRCADAYYHWGDALLCAHEPDEACEKYAKAVEINPQHAGAYSSWALLLSALGRHDEAEEKKRKADGLTAELTKVIPGSQQEPLTAEPDPEAERMSWAMSPDEVSDRWREEGLEYVAAMNRFLERGRTVGWDKVGGEPKDTRQPLARRVMDEVRRANQSGEITDLRDRFPPAHAPFIHMLDENGQHLAPLALLDDGRIVLGIGYGNGHVVVIDGTNVERVSGVLTFGRSPDRKYFAVAREASIDIHEGWGGPRVERLRWPEIGPLEGVQHVDQLIPFPERRGAIVAARAAILAVEPQRTVLLYPREDERLEETWNEHEGHYLDNPHAAISGDGSLISVGDRMACKHLIFNNRYEVVGDIYPLIDCAPCHTSFSDDGQWLTLSSYSLYNGATLGVPTSRFPGLTLGDEDLERCGWFSSRSLVESRGALAKLDPDLALVDDGARVYAAVWRKGEFILGDAAGWLRASDKSGKLHWEHFIGSSVCDIDLSPDGRTLVVTTYAGFLSIIDLDTGDRGPFTIGRATHRERRRWVFWKDEPNPLVW